MLLDSGDVKEAEEPVLNGIVTETLDAELLTSIEELETADDAVGGARPYEKVEEEDSVALIGLTEVAGVGN